MHLAKSGYAGNFPACFSFPADLVMRGMCFSVAGQLESAARNAWNLRHARRHQVVQQPAGQQRGGGRLREGVAAVCAGSSCRPLGGGDALGKGGGQDLATASGVMGECTEEKQGNVNTGVPPFS